MVLAIAKELKALFKADVGFQPIMVRSGDYYVSLKGRRDLARKHQADLFVSIHADAFKRKQAHGASVYALSNGGATSTAALHLAQRENAADLVGGVSLSDKDDVLAGVLADLSMTSTLDTSLQLGNQVLRNVDDIAHLHKKQVEQAGFAVLKSPDVPSILVETGFISNPKESSLLATSRYQKKMASAIHRGIKGWFFAHPPSGTLLAWQKQQGGQQYIIARGDTLSGIADRFSISLADLKSYNRIDSSKYWWTEVEHSQELIILLMSRIFLLSSRLANQIAAGEVVERPASVAKEVLENSLDAGATRIDIDVESGGSKLIRIRDDGSGIPSEDMSLALARHATSKITSLEDLEQVSSLGFRGEALASIGSVSRLTLTSNAHEQGSEGVSAACEGRDMEVQLKPAPHPQGTTVEVRDLFFNTPARRKFLRKEKTEFNHLEEVVKRLALVTFRCDILAAPQWQGSAQFEGGHAAV